MAAFLGLVDAGQNSVLLELRRPGLLVHRQHATLHHLADKDFRADDPAARAARRLPAAVKFVIFSGSEQRSSVLCCRP